MSSCCPSSCSHCRGTKPGCGKGWDEIKSFFISTCEKHNRFQSAQTSLSKLLYCAMILHQLATSKRQQFIRQSLLDSRKLKFFDIIRFQCQLSVIPQTLVRLFQSQRGNYMRPNESWERHLPFLKEPKGVVLTESYYRKRLLLMAGMFENCLLNRLIPLSMGDHQFSLIRRVYSMNLFHVRKTIRRGYAIWLEYVSQDELLSYKLKLM